MTDYLLLIAGMVVLAAAGDALIRGSVGLAEKLKVPPLVIGLTIVAFGTSAPELFISVQAALAGVSGIAIGNVIGSNIANVLLVLGLPALIAPVLCDEDGVGRTILVMIGLTIVFMAMLSDGAISRFEGFALTALLALFLAGQFQVARNASRRVQREAKADIHEDVQAIPARWPVILALTLAGLAGLPIGAQLTVNSASAIARQWDVSEAVIGLTIVALGTSLPELVTSLAATLRGNNSLAIGNVVGSNIFNIAAIMGIAASISPMDVGRRIIVEDMWVMLACTLVLAFIAWRNIRIGRRVGVLFTGLYAAYALSAFLF